MTDHEFDMLQPGDVVADNLTFNRSTYWVVLSTQPAKSTLLECIHDECSVYNIGRRWHATTSQFFILHSRANHD